MDLIMQLLKLTASVVGLATALVKALSEARGQRLKDQDRWHLAKRP